jgi:hypothetical protein
MMVRCLLDLKPFPEDIDNPNVLLTESHRRKVSQLEAVLAHPSPKKGAGRGLNSWYIPMGVENFNISPIQSWGIHF